MQIYCLFSKILVLKLHGCIKEGEGKREEREENGRGREVGRREGEGMKGKGMEREGKEDEARGKRRERGIEREGNRKGKGKRKSS